MTDPSLISLLDDYAINSMIALMQVYAPEEWPEDVDKATSWCEWISARSYLVAASMVAARNNVHATLMQSYQEEVEDANA